MIVVRITWPVKRGAEQKAVELIKSLPDYEIPRPPHGERIYWEYLSPMCEVIHEMQFENVAEWDALVKEMTAAPRFGEVWSKFAELLLPGGGDTEVWNVVALG